MKPNKQFTLSCIAIAICQALLIQSSGAATVTVTSQSDETPLSNPDGCTLRDAIVSTNTASVSADCTTSTSGTFGIDDTILFSSSLSGTISLNNEIMVTTTVEIVGPGEDALTLDNTSTPRVLFLNEADDVVVSDLTFNSAAAVNAIYVLNSDNVVLRNNRFTNFDGGHGVYAYNSNGFQMENCILAGNSGSVGGALNIRRADSFSVTNSLFYDNYASNQGGGISVIDSTNGVIRANTVSGNSASKGGGISVFRSNNITIADTTISGNHSVDAPGLNDDRGGGLFLSSTGSTEPSNIFVHNSTISGNSSGLWGGGVYSSNRLSSTWVNNTIVNNYVTMPGNGGGIKLITGAGLSLGANNIIANNSGGDCDQLLIFSDQASNWIGDDSCTGEADGEPMLGPLEDNKGPTLTHKPLPASKLNRAGDTTACNDTPINGLDQRGVKRGERTCTIGAVEFIDNGSFFTIPMNNGKSIIFSL
ncbi:MAG: right-handed parallel beta-helix repeat-containing protein [Gammaproteobacteria bacterium]|nr:right-handed parallel beta-helix repeat-containing protein [Gammaproteobacteria bacterium]